MPFKRLNPLTFASYSPSNRLGLLAHHHTFLYPASIIILSKILQPLLSLRCTNSLERTPTRPTPICSSSYLASSLNLASACTLLFCSPLTTENRTFQDILS